MMKHRILLLLTAAIVLSLLAGCTGGHAPQGAHKLYYCHTQYRYGADSGVLSFEYYIPPTGAGAQEILHRFLKGPEGNDLVSPFPEGLRLAGLELKDSRAQITLTKELAELNNIDLTIACACIALTVQDITGYATVDIRAQDALLNNQKSIVMNADELILSDILSAQQP